MFLCLAASVTAAAADTVTEFGGHTKMRLLGQMLPGDSILHDLAGSSALDLQADLRLNLRASRDRWSFESGYQLALLQGDSIEYSRNLPLAPVPAFGSLPGDGRRLFDLSSDLRHDDRFAAVHRLDRLWFGYAGEKAVLRFGRQAITWGNGMYFTPMDIVNPFDPTAIDTEYKGGDDMLYGQYLTDAGNDVQGAVVVRRDPQPGGVRARESTAAVKYHRTLPRSEFDVLLARSYGNWLGGIGGIRNVGGAVWRGDVVLTDEESGVVAQLVTNLSYSWAWHERNMSGVIEYYFDGFGQHGRAYDATALAGNPGLLARLARGEAFTVGRHYVAGGVVIEMTPLWQLTPNLLVNAGDRSALLQIVSRHDVSDGCTLLAALNVPVGPAGSEYGGIATALPGRYLSYELGVFAQLAWYF